MRQFFFFLTLAIFLTPQQLWGQGVSSNSGMATAAGVAGFGINSAMAAWMGTKCASDHDGFSCFAAATSAVNAMQMLAGAASAAGTQNAADASGFNPSFEAPGSLDSLTPAQQQALLQADPNASQDLANLKQAQADLAAAGITTDGTNVKFPNGASVPIAGGPGGLTAVGMTPNQIADAEKNAKKVAADIAKKYSVSPVPLETSGSGAGASLSASLSTPDLNFHHGLGLDFKKRDPASAIAGMAKSYHGDPIGVSQDGIFEMIMRRYQAEKNMHAFLDK